MIVVVLGLGALSVPVSLVLAAWAAGMGRRLGGAWRHALWLPLGGAIVQVAGGGGSLLALALYEVFERGTADANVIIALLGMFVASQAVGALAVGASLGINLVGSLLPSDQSTENR